MVLPNSHRVPRVPRYLGNRSRKSDGFYLQDCHLLWLAFPGSSIIHQICNFPTEPDSVRSTPATPSIQRFRALTYTRFGLFPVRSPLLRKSLLFSFPEVTKMFQFTSFASEAYVFSYRCLVITRNGFPHSEISGSKLV
jgi:hypothetical protein